MACLNILRAFTGGKRSSDGEDSRSDSDRENTPEATGGAGGSATGGGAKSGDVAKYDWVPNGHIVRDVYQHFKIEKELGKGASCRVLRVIDKKTGNRYAMKEMKRDDKWNPMLFEQEVRILQKIRKHEHVLQYVDCWMDNTNFYILTQLCVGGELFDKIKELKHFSEKRAREVIHVLLDVLKFIHGLGLVHRDLKPENMVYEDEAQTKMVVIDFGDAKEVQEQDMHEDFVGTAFYLAPESIRNRRGWELKKSDMWTVGVITYVLVTGRPPFWGRNNKETLRRILRCRINFPSTIRLSHECKNFIQALLKTNPAERLSAEEALNHPWITGEIQEPQINIGVLEGLAKFAGSNKLKKLLVRTVAENLDPQRKQQLRTQFQTLDLNGDGRLDADEITEFLISGNYYDENEARAKATEFIGNIVGSNHRRIALQDWSNSSVAKLLSSEQLIKKQYQKLDVNQDQMISADDLLNIFEGASKDEVQKIIDEVDLDHDGNISFDEFREAMKFQPAFIR